MLGLRFLFLASFVSFYFFQGASGNALEELDSDFWIGVDKVCQSVAKERDELTGPAQFLFLRIVEFTRIGYRSHSVYPSAAKSLLRSKNFDPNLPTVIFAHGFTDSPVLLSGQTFAAAYKSLGNYNILAIDSSKLIKVLYMRSATLVKFIGEYVAVFLNELINLGVDSKNIHLVGHSLGAHICGFAGKAFQTLKPNHKLARITGMDPAGPCFFDIGPEGRLDVEDAEFVDILHTNIGVYGLNKTIGSCDFYPNNGGLSQPGCKTSICSHNRAWEYWAEAIEKPDSFIGVECEDDISFDKGMCRSNKRASLGEYTPKDTRGKYYMKTRDSSLFGLGNIGIV